MKLDAETIKLSSMFESMTTAHVKDCFKEEDEVVFVVMPGHMAKAIGKQGVNVKKMSNLLKKNVRILEFSDNPVTFVRNVLRMANVDIIEDQGNVVIHCPDTKTKGQVYGREKERLEKLQKLTKRYFPSCDVLVA